MPLRSPPGIAISLPNGLRAGRPKSWTSTSTSTCTPSPKARHPRRGSIDTVRAAIGLFSDIDARGPGRKKPPETLCPTVADAISVVEEFNELYNPLRVSLLVGSGYGCYPAILFKEPLEVATAEDKKLLEWLGRRFHRALHVIAAKRGWVGAVDYCDVAKVLRLPGCANYKDANNPQPVRLLHETDARYTLSSLDEVLPPLTDERRLFQGFEAASVDAGSVTIDLNATQQVDPELLKALRENHPDFGPTWDNNRPDLKDQSCSGYDLALANIGVACGLTDQQIATLIDVHRREFPRDKQDRRGAHYQKYLQTTIGKARFGKQSSAEAEREWNAMEATLNSPAPVPAGETVQSGESSLGNSTVVERAPCRPPGAWPRVQQMMAVVDLSRCSRGCIRRPMWKRRRPRKRIRLRTSTRRSLPAMGSRSPLARRRSTVLRSSSWLRSARPAASTSSTRTLRWWRHSPTLKSRCCTRN